MNLIPPKLKTYFTNNLKVMATISDSKGEIQWAIFFGTKGKRPAPAGDIDFVGSVDGQNGKPTWEHERPLWLIPISQEARDGAIRSLEANQQPVIKSSAITIRNKVSQIQDWTKYLVWFLDEQNDPVLSLEKGTILEPLSSKGKWLILDADNGKPWAVWLVTMKFEPTDRLIVFPAPQCHIVDAEGNYLNHQLWFGLTKIEGIPFIGVNGSNENAADGRDVPLRWTKRGRQDFFLTPDTSEILSANSWKDQCPFIPVAGSPITKQICTSFRGDHRSTLHAWILKEKITAREISILYTRNYFTRGRLSKHIGFIPEPGIDDANIISNVQVCRANESNLLTKLRFHDRRFIELWNSITLDISESLKRTQSSSPVGVLPRIADLTQKEYSYVSEWETTISCQTTGENQYTLKQSSLFFNGNKEELDFNNIELPLLQHQSPYLPKNQRKIIVLAGPRFTSVDHSFTNDNATLFQFILSTYKLQLRNFKTGAIIDEHIVLRDGALAFTLDKKFANENILPPIKYGRFRLMLQLAKAQRPLFLWQWFEKIDERDTIVVSYSADDFSLAVSEVSASGQDILRKDKLLAPRSLGAAVEGFGERADPPLVIPLNSEKESAENSYLLTFSESVNVGQDHRLDVRLQVLDEIAQKNSSTQIKAVVIDSTPQVTALIDARFLQQPGFDDGAWVLARRSPLSEEEGGWELLDDEASTEGFRLILPSQAIGEAYVKNDLLTNGNPSTTPGEPEDGKPVEYRFGAPAVLRLAPERLERRYVAAPWNLRRIWGQPGDSAPGVPFLEAQFELLYGLTGNLKPEKAFIAEIGSKLGEVPVPPVNNIAWKPTDQQQAAFQKAWTKYLQYYRAWKSRVAILEPSVDDDFGNALFKDDLSFHPRIAFIVNKVFDELIDFLKGCTLPPATIADLIGKTQKLKASIANHASEAIENDRALLVKALKETSGLDQWKQKVEKASLLQKLGASLRYPMKLKEADRVTIDKMDPSDLLDAEKKMIAAHDENGLAGGFHYGFESEAIYKELWREMFAHGSSSAEVTALAFSSLGGWGKQTVRFANDKSVIKSITSMGRTHFYSVERIGRVGVFWNKAKHVIEYERTVVPSIQFEGTQPKHLGRPLVRKVREFVEILEPTRSYPDFATDPRDSPGSVKSCSFKSIKIPVLSSWGRDVWGKDPESGTPASVSIGWELPLWKPGADQKIYPKPQIVLSLLPSPEADEEAVLVNISEPQNLFFYTDTRKEVVIVNKENKQIKERIPITDDVHAWPAVQDVDFTDLPEPEQYDIDPSVDPELLEAPMPDVLDVLPGLERYTFKVDRSELLASVAGRYYPESAITARLRTVSMTRSTYTRNDAWWTEGTEDQVLAKEALRQLIDTKKSILGTAANGFKELEIEVRRPGPLDQNLIDKYKNKISSYKDQVKPSIDKLKLKLPSGIQEPSLITLGSLAGKVGDFNSYPCKWLWRESLESTEGMIQRLLAFYQDQADILLKELKVLLETGSSTVDDAISKLDQLKERIILLHASLELKVDSAFSTVLKTINTASESLNEIICKQFDQIQIAVEKVEPGPDIQALKEELKNVIEKEATAIDGLTERVFGKLKAIKNDRWKQIIEEEVEPAVEATINRYVKALKDVIDETQLPASQLLEYVRSEISNKTNAYKNQILGELQVINTAALELVRTTTEEFDLLNKNLEKIGKKIENILEEEIGKIKKRWDDGEAIVIKTLGEELDKIKDFIRAKLVEIVTPILFTENILSVYTTLKKLDEVFNDLERLVVSSLINFLSGSWSEEDINNWLEAMGSYLRLEDAINRRDKEAILRESVAFANSINKEFGRLAGEVIQALKDFNKAESAGTELLQTGKQTLNNFRSVWEEFTAPGMGLNRRTIAMIVKTDWKDVEQRLSITPCVTRVKQFGEALEGLGLRMPVVALADRLLPAKEAWGDMQKSLLKEFDFSNLLSDLGGMRLDKLLPGVKMPPFARDKIKITQGFEKSSLMAWVNAESDVTLENKKTLMNIGPVKIELERGRFTGKMRLDIDIDGKIKKINSGKLSGSWHITIAGTGLMIFRDTSVIFNNGKLTFDLDPSRMEMPGLLKMLTDATTKLSDTGMAGAGPDGEKIEVFKVGIVKVREIPAGVRATLDLPPVSVGGGTTAMTNLSFGGHFQLLALDSQLKFKFLLELGFYLGKKDAPFNLTIFILGGGGYIDCVLSFAPKEGLSVDFVLSLHASAGLAISAGWMTGSITIMAGFEGEYHKRPHQGSSVYVTIFVRVIGVVNMLSIATLWLGIYLEATYRSLGNGGSELIGYGEVRAELRVCRFIKIKIRKGYTKRFAGSGSQNISLAAVNDTEERAKRANNILKSLV